MPTFNILVIMHPIVVTVTIVMHYDLHNKLED